LPGYIQRQT